MNTSSPVQGAVAVFDAALPPAVAFIRSLGRAGVPVVAYSETKSAPGRFSKYLDDFRICPPVDELDGFVAWLIEEYESGVFELIAPTSDSIAFVVAEAEERLGVDLSGGVGGPAAGQSIRDCLFKDRFSERLDDLGFPVPRWAAPTTLEAAIKEVERLSYPVVSKPRSHVGIGVGRGLVARNESELVASFVPYEIGPGQATGLKYDEDLAIPILQEMIERPDIDCVSITGFLDRRGELRSANCSRKVDQWGRGLSVGTVFETIERPAFFDHAIDTIQKVLHTGIFEFEVLTCRSTGEYWGIDLNPRGYGQIALDIARGDDLPRMWYSDATGRPLPQSSPPDHQPEYWRMATPYYAGMAVRVLRKPDHREHLAATVTALRQRTIGSIHSWSDLGPGVVHALSILRHPGGLVRPFLKE